MMWVRRHGECDSDWRLQKAARGEDAIADEQYDAIVIGTSSSLPGRGGGRLATCQPFCRRVPALHDWRMIRMELGDRVRPTAPRLTNLRRPARGPRTGMILSLLVSVPGTGRDHIPSPELPGRVVDEPAGTVSSRPSSAHARHSSCAARVL
jgi:hypothetical protein